MVAPFAVVIIIRAFSREYARAGAVSRLPARRGEGRFVRMVVAKLDDGCGEKPPP
jgi:hypothetical protein